MTAPRGFGQDDSCPGPTTRTAKVAEAVAQEIVQQIVSSSLPPGTRLPSEAKMLENFGVGRGSLREALRILELHGLIAMKPGRNGGPVVSEARSRDYARMSTLFFQLRGVTFSELIDARLVMEPVMARLAAERRAQVLADPASTDVEDDDTYIPAAHVFHQRVAAMSGNSVLQLLGTSLEDIWCDQVSGILLSADERRDVLADHAAIGAAIAIGQADDAEKLMRVHMRQYADRVRRMRPDMLEAVVDWR